MFASNADNYAI